MTELDQILTRPYEGSRTQGAPGARWAMLTSSAAARGARRLFAARRGREIDEVLVLDANTAASLPASSRGLEVEVLEGSVLVTQSGDHEDHVLETGQRLRFGPRGVAAMAFKPSRVHIRAGAALETVTQSLPWNGATFGSSSR